MKQLIRQRFNKAANTYDEHAQLQHEIANRLFEQFELFNIVPKKMLDIGSGTGKLSQLIASKYTKSELFQVDIAESMLLLSAQQSGKNKKRSNYICADVETLPIKSTSMDIVVSNLMLQWINPLDNALQEIARVLNSGGLFVFSSFGPDTLKELRESWAEVDDSLHTNPFIDMHDIGNALQRMGFVSPVLSNEVITLKYKTVNEIFLDLKQIGANTVTQSKRSTLTGKNRFEAMKNKYDAKRDKEGLLPVTYEVIYAHGWIAKTAAKAKPSDKQVISLNKMKRWLSGRDS